jgi:hypothetical protein
MILKEQDDRWQDIGVLERLLKDPRCDSRIKGRIEDEIRKLKAGDRGERAAAHVLDTHFGKSANWHVLHDLRIEHDGEVAQIDHLLVNRLLDFWVLESKNFANGVKINDHGEFLTFYENRPRGVDSPIEQNLRHLKILQRLIDGGGLKLPTRLGFVLKPRLRSLVLISGGSITRPRTAVPGLETVVRSDQAPSRIQQADSQGSPFDLAKAIGQERLAELGRAILDLHRPIRFDWERRIFGDAARWPSHSGGPDLPPAQRTPRGPSGAGGSRAPVALACEDCTTQITRGVAQYCRRNAEALAGRLLCVDCQGRRRQPAAARIFG